MNQWYSMYHQPPNASYQQWNNQGKHKICILLRPVERLRV